MMQEAIKRALAACNGGPGLTLEEIAESLGIPVALARQDLAALVFTECTVTCAVTRDAKGKPGPGRYRLGDPSALLMVQH